MRTTLTDYSKPVEITVDGILDLHHFNPKDVPDLLNEYFIECIKKKIFSVRIIHGKGKGILRTHVHNILKKHDNVKSHTQTVSGNWGATLVELMETD